MLRSAKLALALAVLLVGSEARAAFTSVFPTASSTRNNVFLLNGDTEIGYFFTTGDAVSQTYTGTGLTSVNELALTLTVSFNNLATGAQVNLGVLINGVTVGSFTRTSAQGTGTVNLDFIFAPIVGNGTYTLGLVETNTVAGGAGSIALAVGTGFTLNPAAVPEPASLAMVGLGLAGVGGLARRRRLRMS